MIDDDPKSIRFICTQLLGKFQLDAIQTELVEFGRAGMPIPQECILHPAGRLRLQPKTAILSQLVVGA
ncbi:MAG: hypothetical protein QNJ47_19335 [Nostocaceae cyanobacterium]|nr:hypothetical protein [Nostocaceae cyanobacterium]